MIPNKKFITLKTDQQLIEKFIIEVIIKPRLKILEWSNFTKQTPGLKIGYPAQHLASLLTGNEGRRTAARGDDLADGSEVKGCSRTDQLDNCTECKNKVLRLEIKCSFCGSEKINRMADSKWLLSVRSTDELDLYKNKIDRFIFILFDYPFFNENNFDIWRIQAFEIWPKFSSCFRELLNAYYENIYKAHIEKTPNKTPAPKNFWPYSFQFYKCSPIKIFESIINDVNNNPTIKTNFFAKPLLDRSQILTEKMPSDLLTTEEVISLIITNEILSKKYYINKNNVENLTKKDILEIAKKFTTDFTFLGSNLYDLIPLRDTSKAITHSKLYQRR